MAVSRVESLVLSLLLLVVPCSLQESQECGSDWFGSNRQYKCHCLDDKCETSGECSAGSYCQPGWFGPACQFVDLAVAGTVRTEPESLFVGNVRIDQPCRGNASRQSITVSWNTSYPFKWMRIRAENLGSMATFKVQFRRDANDKLEDCINQAVYNVTSNTVDVHCEVDMTVKYVVLTGDPVKSICAVHISGGRNIALKQLTVQHGGIYPMLRSRRAVDDNVSQDIKGENCLIFDDKSSLNVIFNQPVVVDRFVIYTSNNTINTTTCCPNDFKYFTLEAYNNNHTKVFSYADSTTKNQLVYSVVAAPRKQVYGVKITAQSPYAVFTVCEVQIFAEDDCNEGFYGLECMNKCSCAGNERCFASTGGCCLRNSCKTDCFKSYGPDCKFNCSKNCKEDENGNSTVCDQVSGACVFGCRSGYQGPTCNESHPESKVAVIVGVVVGVLVSLAVLVIILAVVCYKRRSRADEAELYNRISASRADDYTYAKFIKGAGNNHQSESGAINLAFSREDVDIKQGTSIYENKGSSINDCASNQENKKREETSMKPSGCPYENIETDRSSYEIVETDNSTYESQYTLMTDCTENDVEYVNYK